jgi:hypothetical protein
MRKLVITLFALLPSLWMMWQARGLPHLGYMHDDGLYVGTAAAIADGRGLKLESLPGEPWQVKYPPLFPAYLALGVRWELALTFLVWVSLPALMYQAWRWRGDPVMVFLLGWNVYSVVFASTALSEIFATAWVVLSVRLLEKDKVRWSALCASLAFLARTALIALPAAAVLWLLWKRRWRDAFIFGLIFAPFPAAWFFYTATHATPGVSGEAIYYLSYTKFFWSNMDWQILPVVLSANAHYLVGSLGGLLFFHAGDSYWEGMFARLVMLTACAGLVRQFRRDGLTPYTLMAFPYMALLVVWNFLPNERFVYPLLPLLLEGVLTELRHFRDMLKVTWVTQRAATVVISAFVAVAILWTVERNGYTAFFISPSLPRAYQETVEDRDKVFAWIRANTPAEANFLTFEDPALRRRTGRHGVWIHTPTRFFYNNDNAAIYAYHVNGIDAMRAQNLHYVMIGPNYLAQDINDVERIKILQNWKTRPDLETVYENPHYLIRRLRPLQSGM